MFKLLSRIIIIIIIIKYEKKESKKKLLLQWETASKKGFSELWTVHCFGRV